MWTWGLWVVSHHFLSGTVLCSSSWTPWTEFLCHSVSFTMKVLPWSRLLWTEPGETMSQITVSCSKLWVSEIVSRL